MCITKLPLARCFAAFVRISPSKLWHFSAVRRALIVAATEPGLLLAAYAVAAV